MYAVGRWTALGGPSPEGGLDVPGAFLVLSEVVFEARRYLCVS